MIETSTYEIEPKIITRAINNMVQISESVSLDFKENDDFLDYLKQLSYTDLENILNNPLQIFNQYINNYQGYDKRYYTREEYYASAIISLFDFNQIGLSTISLKQRQQLIDKLIEANVVEVYHQLKMQGVKEDKIANVLLTSIIYRKNINDINVNETFTIEALEDFMGYYKIQEANELILHPYEEIALENGNNILKKHSFYAAIMPTNTWIIAKMLENKQAKMLYLAHNDIVLEQLTDYIVEYIYGMKGTFTKNKKQIIKELFPNLTISTYRFLQSENQDIIINDEYDFIFLDELHRTFTTECNNKIKKLFKHQLSITKVIVLTTYSLRDTDIIDGTDEWARFFGYNEEDIECHVYLAFNLDIEEAIRLGYIISPKIISYEKSLFDSGGILYGLQERIKLIQNEEIKLKLIERFNHLRLKALQSKQLSEIIGDNLHLGDRCVCVLPAWNKEGLLKMIMVVYMIII